MIWELAKAVGDGLDDDPIRVWGEVLEAEHMEALFALLERHGADWSDVAVSALIREIDPGA